MLLCENVIGCCVKAKIKSKGVLEFELVDIGKSWSITDKIPLKEGRFKL
jgi:hypothetical protein